MPHEQPDGTRPAALEFRGVTKSFGATPVLDEFNLSIGRGEKVTLIGPSGSGKTTVLRLAMQLDQPDSGDILLFGDSVRFTASGEFRAEGDRRRLARRCGMVFQQFNLFPHMTVLENLTLAPRMVLGLSKEASRRRAMDYLGMVGLANREGAFPGQLSGGQQQRIAIARTLALRPEVLLLDEVTSALDPELVGGVLEVIRRIAEETDIAFLIITHEMRFAREISDRVAMMDGGVVVECDAPDIIFNNPQNARTRSFLHSVLDY